MKNLAIQEVLDQLPTQELDATLALFLAPLTHRLPDERFRRTARQMIRGVIGSQSPLLTAVAQSQSRDQGSMWAQTKRGYRLLNSARFTHRSFYKGLYGIAQQIVERERPSRLVIALDPVNFEKPYTRKLEGVSTVHKATPPDRKGQARLTPGYPAVTATVVNTKTPVVTYADWFSYTTGFKSENHQLYRAIRISRWLFRNPGGQRVRFVADAGLDDRKIFGWMAGSEFVIRASHLERIVERQAPLEDRWERQPLEAVVRAMTLPFSFRVAFRHAGKTRLATVKVGWTAIRLPDTRQPLWVLVAKEEGETPRTLVLLTNVPLDNLEAAKEVYEDWRLRSRIEHVYRFDQEQGVDVERIMVRTLERMRRLFALVLAAVTFLFSLLATWPPAAVLWLRQLGGKLERSLDRDGPYIVLHGISALLQTVAALSHLHLHPFPHDDFATDAFPRRYG